MSKRGMRVLDGSVPDPAAFRGYLPHRRRRAALLQKQDQAEVRHHGSDRTSNASDVAGIAPGTLAEVKGTLRCDELLTSEMAEKTYAYYSSTVAREYLRPDYDDDNDAGSDRRSEIIAQTAAMWACTRKAPRSTPDRW
jgi:hypothetical protein